MGILIRGGRVVDAAAQIDKIADVYLDDGVIQKVGEKLEAKDKDDKIIDAKGLVVMPGLVDLHVHFRDPGQTEKEDIETGSHAAARGGVTTVVAMPNTTPVIDSPDRANYVKNKAAQVSAIHVLQAGAMTKGELGEELSDIAGMAAAGGPVLSEDGKSVMKASLCKQAMEEAVKAGLPIFDHCEDMSLRGNGCMNEDENAKRLGLPGICNSTEDTIAARDSLLAIETGAKLHLCHCSTKGVAIMMKMLKAEGVENVTAEVCPHHFILTSDDIERDDPNYKMNPPLRTRKDVDALIPLVIRYMRMMAPFFVFYAVAEAYSGACCGLGETLVPMVTTLLTICLFRVVAIFVLLPKFGTMECIVRIYIASWILAGCAFVVLYSVKERKLHRKYNC